MPYIIVILMVFELWLVSSVSEGKLGEWLGLRRYRDRILWIGILVMIGTSVAYIVFGGK